MRLLAVLALPAALAGCVERFIVVRSDPPGAAVYLDQEKVGTTPCEVPYTWYGKRELVLELPRHRPVRELVSLDPPWWQYFPLDFITDVLLPFTLSDRAEFSYTLEPSVPTREEREAIRSRAQELRDRLGVTDP
jgi:hypothetical protein